MFQINQKDINLSSLIDNSKYTKKDIASKLGISTQWLNKQLAKPTEELPLIFLKEILNSLGYHITVVLNCRQ